MRPSNGQLFPQCYRVINGNKKHKVVAEDNLSTSRSKRWDQETFKNKTKQNLSPEHEDYDEADLQSDMEDDASDTDSEQVEEQKRAFESVASTVRPLLQLFSEDSRTKSNNLAPVHPSTRASAPATVHPQIYNDISLSSDEDDQQTEELHDEDASVSFNDDFIPPLTEETIPPKSNNPKRFIWTPKSTNLFLDLWEKNLKGIRGKRKNTLIHKEMAQDMSAYGLSHREIKCKMDNMTRKQRLEAEKIKLGNRTNWRYYKRVKSLLTGPVGVDFEQVLVDTNDSSTLFEQYNSDTGSEANEMTREDDDHDDSMTRDEEEQLEAIEQVDEKEEAPAIKTPLKDEHPIESVTAPSTTDQLLQIEQEKLEVEKQKLQVMKHISRDLLSISKTLIELLRNTKK